MRLEHRFVDCGRVDLPGARALGDAAGGAGDFAAPPIAQRHGELEGPVAGNHLLRAADHLHEFPAEALAVANHLDANAIAVKFGDLRP